MELWERFTDNARQTVLNAQHEATRSQSEQIAPAHLLLGLLEVRHGFAFDLLSDRIGDLAAFEMKLRGRLPTGEKAAPDEVSFAPESRFLLQRAYEEAKLLGSQYIRAEHLLLGLLADQETSALLAQHGVDLQEVRQVIAEEGHGHCAS